MKSLKLGLTTLILASITASLTTAGTPQALLGSPRALQAQPVVSSSSNSTQDFAHLLPTSGSPRANSLSADLRRTPSDRMDCCAAVITRGSTVTPRAAEALKGAAPASPVGLKCSMGQPATKATGCCAPARKASCCG